MKQNYYVIKYLSGGFGSFSRVGIDSGYAKNHEEFLSKFWSRYEGMLDCVKPVILRLHLREKGNETEIQLTDAQKCGKCCA